MKKIVLATMALAFLVAQAVPANALQIDFAVSANIVKVTNVSITATSVLSNDSTKRTIITNNVLSMDPMNYNGQLGNYLPDHYFVIDCGATGAGLQVTMSYSEPSNPNGVNGHGLGWKTTATFKKVAIVNNAEQESVISGHGDTNGKKLLKDVTNEVFSTAQTANGWLRTYVGVNYTGDPLQTAGAEMFTNADAAGTYSGTLRVTALAV